MDLKERINQERDDVSWVCSTEQGRRFLWRLLSFCGVYHDFEGDTQDMLKKIGRRQVGLHLLGVISDANEDIIFDMMKEAKARKIEEDLNERRKSEQSSNEYTSAGEFPEFDSSAGGVVI